MRPLCILLQVRFILGERCEIRQGRPGHQLVKIIRVPSLIDKKYSNANKFRKHTTSINIFQVEESNFNGLKIFIKW